MSGAGPSNAPASAADVELLQARQFGHGWQRHPKRLCGDGQPLQLRQREAGLRQLHVVVSAVLDWIGNQQLLCRCNGGCYQQTKATVVQRLQGTPAVAQIAADTIRQSCTLPALHEPSIHLPYVEGHEKRVESANLKDLEGRLAGCQDAHLQSLQLTAVQEVLQQAAMPVATEHPKLPQTIAVVGAEKGAKDVQAHEASN